MLTGSTVGERTREPERASSSTGGGIGVLTVFAALLFLIPADLVIGPLGAAGSPASLVGLLCLLLWINRRVMPDPARPSGTQPVRIALGVFGLVVLVSYAHGNLYPLQGSEISAADRGLLTIASWSGVALFAADVIRTTAAAERMLRRLVALSSAIAVIGLLQFAMGIDLPAIVKIPGLSLNGDLQGIQTGGGPLRRIASTASHPIEFGMVLALMLPFALYLAFTAKRHRVRWWVATLLIASVLPMSISRSAVLALAVEFVVLFVVWSPTRRLAAILMAPVFIVVLRLSSPGLVGTIFGQFANAGSDPSLQGRADSRGAVGGLIRESPWLGRGFNTFIPSNYIDLGLTGVNHGSLDNQYLGTIVEMGYVGLAAMIFLLVVALGVARGIRIRALDEKRRELGQTFLAAFLATAIGMGTFDGFGFPMFTGLFFLLFGIAAAIWRITADEWRQRQAGVLAPRASAAARS